LQIIPVIDLMDGRVVHARGGDRSGYRPVRSVLCGSSEPSSSQQCTSQPWTIVEALLRLHAFNTLYIADLDAIRGRVDNLSCVLDIHHRYPALEIWLDDGLYTAPPALRRRAPDGRIRLVVGSESVTHPHLPEMRALFAGADAPVLSLDFQAGAFVGPPDLLTDIARWPPKVIIMSLARVGSGTGPDLDRLLHFAARSPHTEWYVGGGVRHADDLHALASAGARGALVASVLHNGGVGANDLAAFSKC